MSAAIKGCPAWQNSAGLAQRQTLNPEKPAPNWYCGLDKLGWHPFDDLPRMSLEDRYKSFCERLLAAKARYSHERD